MRIRRFRNVRAALAVLSSLLTVLGPAAGAASAAPELLGDWQGTVDTGGGSLRVVFHLAQDKNRTLTGTMDSPDQGAAGIALSSVTYDRPDVHFAIDRIGSRFEGKLDKDDLRIVGVWTQGSASLPLTLGRLGK